MRFLVTALVVASTAIAGAHPTTEITPAAAPTAHPRGLVNLRHAASLPMVGTRLAAFMVREAAQGERDLNGDGDSGDSVVHQLDLRRRTVSSTGLAGRAVGVGSSYLALGVDESAQGGEDLNGDGDVEDVVLHIQGDRLVNVGLPVRAFGFAAGDRQVAFLVSEADHGGANLNGDGDDEHSDLVLHVLDVQSAGARSLRIAVTLPLLEVLDDRYLLYVASERAQGEDLNGDLDALDFLLVLHDLRDATSRILGPVPETRAQIAVAGHLVVFGGYEPFVDSDLNGDGDTADSLILLFDRRDGTTAKLDLALPPPGANPFGSELLASEGLVAMRISEGSGRDLNGDGDFVDAVLHVYDVRTRRLENLGLATGLSLSIAGGTIAFNVPEPGQGGQDLDGDGTSTGNILFVHHAGESFELGQASAVSRFNLGPGIAAFARFEVTYSTDLNSDGDSVDHVLHIFDARSRSVRNLGFAVRSESVRVGSTRVWFLVDEFSQGQQDLNGDGRVGGGGGLLFGAHSRSGRAEMLSPLVMFDREYSLEKGFLSAQIWESVNGFGDFNGDGDGSDIILFASWQP